MSANNNRVTIIGTLSVAALAILAAFISTADNVQAVDAVSRAQPLVCDGSDKVITFPNFVTAYVWLEKIRWEKAGSYSFGMQYITGEKVILSYQCTKA